MSSYLQMGNQNQNLVGEIDLDNFSGIVLSPLNNTPEELLLYVSKFKKIKKYDIVLDPQLYYPRTLKDKIKLHPYFPKDFDTSDYSSLGWWKEINSKLLDYAKYLEINTIISPTIDPKTNNLDYYKLAVDVSNDLNNINKDKSIPKMWSSIIIEINSICNDTYLMELASIISLSESDGFYIIFKSDLASRQEYNDEQQIKAMMSLISQLNILKKEIMISFSGSDMVLFKLAGATHCGTGNFWNLRRFTKARFEESPNGGGQSGYLFEHNLMSFLRESDIKRISRSIYSDYIPSILSNNYWTNKIFQDFKRYPGKPWVRLGWRQYLSWFSKIESMLNKSDTKKLVNEWLKEAEDRWLLLEDANILMEEQKNNGKWLRAWRQAAIEV